MINPKIKNPEAYKNFDKLIKVVVSCKTLDQCNVAMRYVAQFHKRYDLSQKTNPLLHRYCGELIAYLIDTRDHIEYGYHYPLWNQSKKVSTYPDVNKYVEIPGIRLKNY